MNDDVTATMVPKLCSIRVKDCGIGSRIPECRELAATAGEVWAVHRIFGADWDLKDLDALF